MMILKEKYNQINTILLVLILSTIFFRSVSTILIMVFIAFNLLNFKQLSFKKKNLIYLLILCIPFLLEILFFWNNIGSDRMFKPIEKVISFLVFPLFIVSNYQSYQFFKIAKWYSKITTILMVILMIRFCIVAPDYVQKYINGIHLWEMGYVFTQSFGNHAPAVNMIIAFVVVLNFYFLLKEKSGKFLNTIFLLASIVALFIINTRLSLGSAMVCCLLMIIVFAYQNYKQKVIYFIGGFVALSSGILLIAFLSNPYMKEKYSKVTFANLDKIGKLDEVENPDAVLHNALVTRLSIWKSAIELGSDKVVFGYGSVNGKAKLANYFQETDQKFLAKYAFPVHNQFLDYLLKFGLVGTIALMIYFLFIFRISIIANNIVGVCFTLNFLLSNLFDDFLIRFDGIVFSAVWFSLIVGYYLNQINANKSLKVD